MLGTDADAEPAVDLALSFAAVFANGTHNCHLFCLSPSKLSDTHYPLCRARAVRRYFACGVILGHSECSISDLSSIAIVAEGPPQPLHSDSDSQSSRFKET